MATSARDPAPGTFSRILAHPLTLLILGEALVGFPAIVLASFGPNQIRAINPALVFPFTVAAVMATFVAYRAFKRWIERKPDGELPLGMGSLKEVTGGFALGVALFSLLVGAVALMGGLKVTGMGHGTIFFPIAAMSLAAGVNEEVMFRAIGFRFVEKLGGSIVGLFAASLFFGLAHLANPGASLFAAVAIAVEAGILLGAAYMVTRRLWLAVGLHAGWNFTQGFIWSIPVSGNPAGDGLFLTERNGPDWLTGGAFGLEASAVTLVIATIAGLIMLRIAIRRGHWVPFGWLPPTDEAKSA